MKIHIDLPWGGKLYIEWEPMEQGRFEVICWLVGILLIGSGILKFFALMV